MSTARIHTGDALEVLGTLPDESVQCCVTSPPYWGGLRDYAEERQLGFERQPPDYVAELVKVFGGVRRVLRGDGTLWCNIGDVYAASGKGGGGNQGDRASWQTVSERKGFRMPPPGYKMKDLTLSPFLLAEALRRDGWYLRATVVWSKPSAVEPMRLDRPALSHEYLFLFSKSEQYACRDAGEPWWSSTVWQITPERGVDHPATMPAELARRCIVCSTNEGDTVLDPFAGSGTTGMVATGHGRDAILIDLNPEYVKMMEQRIGPMFVEVP